MNKDSRGLVDGARHLRTMLDDFLAEQDAPSPAAPGRGLADASDVASRLLAWRGLRNRLFGPDADVFGEPAWDILLDLYVHEGRRRITVTSACAAARVPPTTALRWITVLERRGLIGREAHRSDRRAKYVSLTSRGVDLMRAVLEHGLADLRG